jgi:type IV pilus assembly protein PilX
MKEFSNLQRERGVALAMVLMVLVVLTILGISAMKTSILEVRMSGNVQDGTTAFQVAESGLLSAVNANLDIYNASTSTYIPPGSTTAQAVVQTQFDAMSNPPRGSGYSAIHYQVANFKQTSTGTTTSGAQAIINQGMFQVVNK